MGKSMWIAALAVATSCGKSSAPATIDGASTPDSVSAPDAPPAIVDLDGDGLDDVYETKLAVDYMPYLSLAANDGCALDGMLVRVRPHPADATKILIVYDHLLEHDCGLSGHVGDDEVFGVAIDPKIPAPAGILAIRAASHQGTATHNVRVHAGPSRRSCTSIRGTRRRISAAPATSRAISSMPRSKPRPARLNASSRRTSRASAAAS